MGYIYTNFSYTTAILLGLSTILFSGFFLTRLTKLIRLPNVSGYIIAGVMIGPSVFHIIPKTMVDNMSFVSDIALAFIAFGVGKYFKKDVLKETGAKVVIITLFESLIPGILIAITVFYVFHMDLNFALLLGAIATATAPASTVMTINQYHAHGEFVNTLLQIVAFDDVICLLAYSVVVAIVTANAQGGFKFLDILLPILYNLAAILLGVLLAFALSKLLKPKRSTDNRLILTIAMLLALSGLCSILDVSPLLSCMVFGAVYINLTKDKELFNQVNAFTPPIMSCFFIISGMNLDLGSLREVGLIGVSYFIIRIFGKYLGAFLGCHLTGTMKSLRNYLGVALIPQAGVSIGLAFLGQRILPPEIGNLLLTIILSSSVLYELIGPVCAKFALFRSGTIEHGKSEVKVS